MKETGIQHAASRRTIDRLRTLAGRLSLAAAVTTFAACGGDGGPSTPSGPTTYANPVGAYEVSTINAKSLPVAIFSGDSYSYEVLSSALSLTADGKFSVKETYRQTIAGKVDLFNDSTGGTWVLSGTTVNFVNGQDGSANRADWSNSGSLTFT